MQQAKGATLLLVMGIIYVVIGGLAIIGGIGLAATASMLALAGIPMVGFLAFIAIIAGAWSLIVGILGIINRSKLEKASMLMIIGIVALALDLLSFILSASIMAFSVLSLVGLVIPILYIIGAHQNKTQFQQQQ